MEESRKGRMITDKNRQNRQNLGKEKGEQAKRCLGRNW